MKSLTKKFDTLISKQTNIFSAAFFIILTTIFSQLLGLFKYRLLVSLFGASNDLGIFFAAFRIPDFIFQVAIAGALSTSFIPVFSEYVARAKQQETNGFTSSLINIGIIFYITVTVVVIVFARPLVGMVAPGFTPKELDLYGTIHDFDTTCSALFDLGDNSNRSLAVSETFSCSGFGNCFLQCGNYCRTSCCCPVFWNLRRCSWCYAWIALLFLVQIPILSRSGFKYLPTLDLGNGVLKIVNLMISRGQ